MVPSDFGENRSAGGLPEPPREKYWATWALVERERGGQGGPHAPSPSGPNWTRRGGRRPPFPSPSPPSFPPPSRSRKEGSPTPTRRRTPPPGAPLRAGQPPPCSFIYRGRGHPKETTIDRSFSRVRCPLHHSPPR